MPADSAASRFQSTPPGWRATSILGVYSGFRQVSIHAPRVEGDMPGRVMVDGSKVSIHAPRVEGDTKQRGGHCPTAQFQSTPPGWRATRRNKP